MTEDYDKSGDIEFRAPKPEDGKEIHSLVKKSKVLDVNSEYLYLLLGVHFSKTCVVACDGKKIIGFVSAYIMPDKSESLFVWQIAVDSDYRKRGIALKMLENLLKRPELQKIRQLELTISPSNISSQNLFKSLAAKLGLKISEESFLSSDFFNGDHEEENLFIIGPINNQRGNND